MECELEAMVPRMSEGQKIDLDQYGRLTCRLCRLLELVGVRHLTKPIDPFSDLAKAFAGHAGKPVDDDEPNDENESACNRARPRPH
jgi:transcription elongation factor Elf1